MERLISNALPIFAVSWGVGYVTFFLALINLRFTTGDFIVREALDDRNW
jgi:hypothetical protein